jgi:hypothetical protein
MRHKRTAFVIVGEGYVISQPAWNVYLGRIRVTGVDVFAPGRLRLMRIDVPGLITLS